MKKTIATKQIKLWQRLDRLVIAVPIIVFLYLSMGKYGRQIWRIILNEQDMAVIVGALLFLISATAITALPIVLIWRAISHTVKKSAIRNATFRIDEDFDYFREKLTGISPATISLLMDLKIEDKKDIAALLLKYVKIGAVSMEGGEVRVLDCENLELLSSDRTLLTLIDKRQAQPANLGTWKKQVMAEAVESGNLKYRGVNQNISSMSGTCLTGCLSGCLLPILLFIVMCICSTIIVNSGWIDRIDSLFAATPQSFETDQLKYFFSSPEFLAALGVGTLIILIFIAMGLLPIAAVLRMVLSASNANILLRRTKEGELLTAQISGMKNFIRDFSNLAEAEKEQLILWDDFLIYAVVLEENERIIEDIFKMKNLRYQDFKIF